jgi:hypothetical protein
MGASLAVSHKAHSVNSRPFRRPESRLVKMLCRLMSPRK